MQLKFLVLLMVIGGLVFGPEVAPLGSYTERERGHWAFMQRSNPVIPELTEAADRAWATTPIDAFILQRLRKAGLRPSPAADRATLIRRLSFDLTGLPPTPQEVAAFIADKSPQAWDHLVERLLASPHYGERWGQHWLDVARFAETDGFEYDTHRQDAWRYRDYVVRSFNEDKPFDRFIIEQLAGDELAGDSLGVGHPKGAGDGEDSLIAAGFNRLGPLRKNAGNQEVTSSRNEVLTEMTNAVGTAFLGVTLGCARCHNHKFDPIRQSDYYRIQAFFAATYENDVVRATPEAQAAWKAKAEPIEKQIKEVTATVNKLRMKDDAASRQQLALAMKQLDDLQESLPPTLPLLRSVTNQMEKRSPIHLLARGEYTAKGESVGMRTLGVLLPEGSPELPPTTARPRLELARWIASPTNPLTARVMVNRIWLHHFGAGIVETPNDFGRAGARPSHPELLDYLANQFVASGFSIKHLHRLILRSNTYRQSSASPTDPAIRELAISKDPENRLLWRFNRQRLEAEQLRDAILAVAGTLNPKQGGPGVMVPLTPDLVSMLYNPLQWRPAKDPGEHTRRSIYLIAKRNLRLPMMEVFDSPDMQASCPRRESSTHAPQALELLNGPFANQQAEALARRLEAEAGSSLRRQADFGYRLVAGRAARPEEIRVALEFLRTQPKREFALALLNLNAFLYIN